MIMVLEIVYQDIHTPRQSLILLQTCLYSLLHYPITKTALVVGWYRKYGKISLTCEPCCLSTVSHCVAGNWSIFYGLVFCVSFTTWYFILPSGLPFWFYTVFETLIISNRSLFILRGSCHPSKDLMGNPADDKQVVLVLYILYPKM